ncbi:ferredoxin [Skermania sp. ID1734]|uniref:ferredoxin n=1 Tax=Skermania sp. ID1734 TaxID=2597516 RepID=UPI00117BE969|nr:ferredoxin [Skermania sp. ID1734]TSD94450.1 ferredoxin [Skermania sp. ID1734]
MTRAEVDRDRCEGHGFCESLVPDLFAVDSDGKSSVLQDSVSDVAGAELAAESCPVAAIRLLNG